MEILKIVTLSLSSLLLVFVGLMRLTNPIKTYSKNSGIELPNSTSLLNEIRGISALMLLGGIIVVSGIFITSITFTSFIIASLIFIGFAIGRVISILADGKPSKQIMQGIASELVLGAMNLFCVVAI